MASFIYRFESTIYTFSHLLSSSLYPSCNSTFGWMKRKSIKRGNHIAFKKKKNKINKSILTCWTIWNISPWQIYHALASLISLGLQYSLDFIFNSSWKSLSSHACDISTRGMQRLASTAFHHSLSILLFVPSKPTPNRWRCWVLLPAANVASSPRIAAVLITFLLLWQSDLQKEDFIWASSSSGIRVIVAMKMTVSSVVAGSGSCETTFVYPQAQNREKIGNRARLYVVLELDLNEVLTPARLHHLNLLKHQDQPSLQIFKPYYGKILLIRIPYHSPCPT